MSILVTGSSGHLGEALVRTLQEMNQTVSGIDLVPGLFTAKTGSVSDPVFVSECMKNVAVVLHTATLHKPHVATHSYQHFIDTNITGTLTLLEAAARAGAHTFVFTSTTSTFGDALTPAANEPAAWITEDIQPVPKNIYGVTKTAAEDICRLFHRNHGLACIVLKTSRFFPEEDDQLSIRQLYGERNCKANELLYRRVDMEDVVNAHLLAMEKGRSIGYGRYIISASTPFTKEQLPALHQDAPAVVKQLFPDYETEYRKRNWKMFPAIDRVYVNVLARKELGWNPKYDFAHVLRQLKAGNDFLSPLALQTGSKGYHAISAASGPYFMQ
jgi:UDP-glucose 4-epimerase